MFPDNMRIVSINTSHLHIMYIESHSINVEKSSLDTSFIFV